MSHLDSFDPKPNAPVEIRGEFGTVDTKVAGIQLCGLWQQTAGVADKLAIIRSMTHDETTHERGCQHMLTGWRPNDRRVAPSLGSVVAHECGPRNNLPAYIAAPGADGGCGFAGSGHLSPANGAFSIGGDPNDDSFIVRDLNLPRGARDSFSRGTCSLISSREAREAFNITAESTATRDAYGRNEFGQRALLARRLVEAGARYITLFCGGWDMHADVHGGMGRRVPPLDQALAMLIKDLDQRGLLRTTLVVVSTEFGRSPRINKDRGRDHSAKVFSVAFAGAGIRGGQVVGSSNAEAMEPRDHPVTPADLAATIFSKLGIHPNTTLPGPGDHPLAVLHDGEIIQALA